MKIEYHSIGIIHTSFKSIEGMPIQPSGAESIQGTVTVFPEYSKALKDLEGFSHVILLYHFHRAGKAKMVVTPFLDSQPHGIFSTRAPKRPNPIGISVVKLRKIDGNILYIENVDILDGTPLLDIKPYVPEFDRYPADKVGWLERTKGFVKNAKSDKRFR